MQVTSKDAFVLLLIAASARWANAGCTFNLTNSETEKYLPVPLFNISSNYEFAIPHHGLIHLEQGQNISLLCAGTRNYVRQTQSNVTTVTCIENDEVKLFRNHYKFEEIQCKNIVRGEIRSTNKKCGNNQGVIYQIGYTVTRKEWITLITLCYVPEIGNTLYTRHVLHGSEIKYASKSQYRPSFSKAGHNDNIRAAEAYKKTEQKVAFDRILGSSESRESSSQYINDKSFLAKGHLSPDADFLLATAQFSTHHYINTAPQWQSVNGASWKSIEHTVRHLSTHYGDVDVITGTHGILSYDDHEGNPQNITLGEGGTLPVPKYFWKIVYDPKTKKATVFVILNDPFVTTVDEEVFCEDICKNNQFKKNSWKEPATGYVFCCTYNDFSRSVLTVPKLEVSDVLVAPSVGVQTVIDGVAMVTVY